MQQLEGEKLASSHLVHGIYLTRVLLWVPVGLVCWVLLAFANRCSFCRDPASLWQRHSPEFGPLHMTRCTLDLSERGILLLLGFIEWRKGELIDGTTRRRGFKRVLPLLERHGNFNGDDVTNHPTGFYARQHRTHDSHHA